MSKVLVVSYSLSGTTRAVANEIADALSAETYEIAEARLRRGVVDYLLAGFESLAKGIPSILDDCDPSEYDLVILGTPVWAGSMASPMRSFLFAHGREMKRVACFCTMGGRGAEATLKEMKVLCNAEDALTFFARESDVHSGAHGVRLDDFIRSLKRASERVVTAVA